MEKSNTDLKYIVPQKETTGEEQEAEVMQSYLLVKRLLPFLAKRGIPASPLNYRLFYDYLANTNPKLCLTLNELLESNAKFFTPLSQSLYEHFYAIESSSCKEEAEAVNKATLDFMAISKFLEENLESASQSTTSYQNFLLETSKQLSSESSGNDLTQYLDGLLAETEQSLANSENLTNQIAAAQKRITELTNELEAQAQLAVTDELTKFFNRRHLNRVFPQIIVDAQKNNAPLSLIIFDLDRFKRINDTWGHNFGDKVLQVFASVVRDVASKNHLPVRLGGEEFVLVCPGLPLASAKVLADSARINLMETNITIRGEELSVTVSGGVAQHKPGEELSDLIGRADAALYRAKDEGRNQIYCSEE